MGWVMGWLGGGGTVVAEDETPVTPTPVASPLVSSDPEYHDHAEHAINRLCQFAKRRADS